MAQRTCDDVSINDHATSLQIHLDPSHAELDCCFGPKLNIYCKVRRKYEVSYVSLNVPLPPQTSKISGEKKEIPLENVRVSFSTKVDYRFLRKPGVGIFLLGIFWGDGVVNDQMV